MAENLALPEVLAQALTTKGVILFSHGRRLESLALVQFGLQLAIEHDKPSAALRASYNLADMLSQNDRYREAADVVRDGLAQSRRVGNRYWELGFLGHSFMFLASGEWDEALAMAAELPSEEWEQTRQAFIGVPFLQATVGAHRGTPEHAVSVVDRFRAMGESADVQERAAYTLANARLALSHGNPADALVMAEQAFAVNTDFGYASEIVKEAFVVACEAALALGDTARLEKQLSDVEGLPTGRSSAFLRAQALRFRAHLERTDDPVAAATHFIASAALFSEIGVPFYLAVVQLEYAELLAESGAAADGAPLLLEAREIFERLRAAPWLERLADVAGTPQVGVTA